MARITPVRQPSRRPAGVARAAEARSPTTVIKLWLFIRTALSGLRQLPFVHGVAVLTLAVALFAGALARAGQRGVGALLAHLDTDVEVTAYLADSMKPDQVEALRGRLARDSGGAVRVVSPAEALARLQKELGPDGAVLDGLAQNPLPTSLELLPPPGPPNAARLAALAAAWSKLPGVTGVDYGRAWVDRLAALRRALALGAGALLLMVLLAAVVVVAATLQLGMYARRDEIAIQKLVGATDTFVRTPYVLEGLLQGLLGAALASGGLFLCHVFLGPVVARALEGLGPLPAQLSLVSARRLTEVAAAGAGLGILGSTIAVGRFLKV